MNSKILLTAWTLVSAAMAAPDLAAAQAQVGAAGADSLDGLISLQTASDRMNIELDQVVRAAVARGVKYGLVVLSTKVRLYLLVLRSIPR